MRLSEIGVLLSFQQVGQNVSHIESIHVRVFKVGAFDAHSPVVLLLKGMIGKCNKIAIF